jgi:hypothetical protein
MNYDPNTVEQGLELKDGRKIGKTHNGFRAFVIGQKGKVTPITLEYYAKVKHLSIGSWSMAK